MDFLVRRSQKSSEGQATFGMANLRQKTTGLPFIVFISQRDDARHAARVKVSAEPRIAKDAMSSYSIEPFRLRAGPGLTSPEENLLKQWIDLNKQILIDYWNGVVEYTEDALDLLKKLPASP